MLAVLAAACAVGAPALARAAEMGPSSADPVRCPKPNPLRDLLSGPLGDHSACPLNHPPSAAFDAPSGLVFTGETVTFDGSASSDPDGSIVRYEWDLDGDGVFETDGGHSSHTTTIYSRAGVRAVSLRVSDDDGATATVEHDVRVATVVEGGGEPRVQMAIYPNAMAPPGVRELRVAVGCFAEAAKRCRGTLKLAVGRKHPVRLGHSAFSIEPGARKQIEVRLTRRGREVLLKTKRPAVRATAMMSYGGKVMRISRWLRISAKHSGN
jgi:PKD domain-containing protein